MNKKEKGFLENNLYECEMSRLRTAAKMKDKKTKESRFVAHAAKFAAEEAANLQKLRPGRRRHPGKSPGNL